MRHTSFTGLQDICRQSEAPFVSLKQAPGKRDALDQDNVGHLVGAAGFSQCSAQSIHRTFNQHKEDTDGTVTLSSSPFVYGDPKFFHVSTPSAAAKFGVAILDRSQSAAHAYCAWQAFPLIAKLARQQTLTLLQLQASSTQKTSNGAR